MPDFQPPQPPPPPAEPGEPGFYTYAVFNGLRNDRTSERFDNADLEIANNVDIDNSGEISRRSGYSLLSGVACHSLWSDNAQCFAVIGGNLVKVANDYSTTPIKALVDGLSWMSYVKVNDSVYASNGIDSCIIAAGVCRTWGIAVPSLPNVSVTVGYMPAGTYQFAMTYMRQDGQESGAPLCGVVTVPDGSGLTFTMPVSNDSGVKVKNIYISSANSEMPYLAFQVTNATVTASYTANTLELTVPLLTQFLSAPPPGQKVAYYRGHLFVAAGNMIYPSEPFAYELFDMRKGIPMDGRVTMMAIIEDKERMANTGGMESGIFVGTDRNCGALIGKDADGFQYVNKLDYGAVEGSQLYVDGSLYGDDAMGARMLPVWLTAQGVCVGMDQMEIRNISRTKYGFPAAGRGAAIFRPAENRLVFTANF